MGLRLSNGQKLQSPPGLVARPTLALVREAVMNSLRPQIPGSRWLDLCSGSGAMACEALLHGAAFVQLVEENRRIAAVARSNLEALGDAYRNKWQLAVSEVERWLNSRRNPAKTEIFSLIYGDPPYRSNLYGSIAKAIYASNWLAPTGRLLLECSRDETPSCEAPWLELSRKRYGRTLVLQWQLLAAEGTAPAILIPGGNKKTYQGYGDQAQNDAAKERFDHQPDLVDRVD